MSAKRVGYGKEGKVGWGRQEMEVKGWRRREGSGGERESQGYPTLEHKHHAPARLSQEQKAWSSPQNTGSLGWSTFWRENSFLLFLIISREPLFFFLKVNLHTDSLRLTTPYWPKPCQQPAPSTRQTVSPGWGALLSLPCRSTIPSL